MIGLMFFGAIGLWGLISIFLGFKIPKWIGIKKYRGVWVLLFIPLVFFAPVADEIIAYPQWIGECKNIGDYRFVSGVNPEEFRGNEVYYDDESYYLSVFPPTVKIKKNYVAYFDKVTGNPIVFYPGVSVEHGLLGLPAGSSGNKMPALWRGCHTKKVSYIGKSPKLLYELNVKEVNRESTTSHFELIKE